MKNFVRTTLLAATLAGVSLALSPPLSPILPARPDPIVQHLKLTNDQITRIKNFTNNWKPTSVRFL